MASWGRQAGKTTCALNEITARAWARPNTKYWYVSPSDEQATELYFILKHRLISCGVIEYHNDTRHLLVLINGSHITFKSGAVMHRLRGATLHGVVIDEVRDQPKGLWTQVIQPMLRTTKGWALFISTPNGFDAFHKLFLNASQKVPGWQSFQAPSICNPAFPKEEYEDARRNMSEPEFAQEILAQFRNLTAGLVYVNHGEWNWCKTNPFARNGERISPHLPIIVGMDFNIKNMSWHLGQFNQNKIWWFGRIYITQRTNTPEAATELVHRVKDHKPGVILIGDSTGRSGSRQSAVGASDYAIVEEALTKAGIKWENRTPDDGNPTHKDRANMMNMAMRAQDGSVKFLYDPDECPELKTDLECVHWKEGAQALIDKSDPDLTHASESVGYPVCVLFDMWTPGPGTLSVIVR